MGKTSCSSYSTRRNPIFFTLPSKQRCWPYHILPQIARISTPPSDSNARHIQLNHSVDWWCLTQHPGMHEDAQPWQPPKRSTKLVKNVRWQLWRAAQSPSAIQTPSKQRRQQVQSCEMGMGMQEQGGRRRPERPGASPSPSPGLQILSATLKC